MGARQKIQVLFHDEALLVVHKPSGLLTIPDRHRPDLPHLKGRLEIEWGRVWVVHRLDRETSGLLVFARDAETHRHLSLQFEHREVKKAYLALVEGNPQPESGDLSFPIAPHPRVSGKMTVHRSGKPAHSWYRTLEAFRRFALLEVEIYTGRTHQIRVHLAEIGCPLAVDPLYGRRPELFLSEIKGRAYRSGKHEVERPLLRRLSLHAHRLTFTHPHRGEPLATEALRPKDLRAALNQLRKWDAR